MLSHTTVRPVYAGIDFHKKSITVALGDAHGNLIGNTHTLPTDAKLIRRFFLRYSGLKCAVENCRAFDWIVALLREIGIEVHISNPYKTRLIAESTCKTDSIDSKVLMQLLAKDYLPTCYFPDLPARLTKERLRWRKQLVGSSTRFKNRCTVLLDKENKGHSPQYSAVGRQIIEQIDLFPERKELVSKHLALIEHLESSRHQEDRWVQMKAKEVPECSLLKTIPGFGEVTAVTLWAETGDVSRFPRSNSFTSYLGLNPRLYSSANTRRLGGITKRGQNELRALLVQAAWTAIKHSFVLKKRYQAIAKRRGKKIAIVAIARLLAEISYHILRTGQPYDESKLALG
jgi:transposase